MLYISQTYSTSTHIFPRLIQHLHTYFPDLNSIHTHISQTYTASTHILPRLIQHPHTYFPDLYSIYTYISQTYTASTHIFPRRMQHLHIYFPDLYSIHTHISQTYTSKQTISIMVMFLSSQCTRVNVILIYCLYIHLYEQVNTSNVTCIRSISTCVYMYIYFSSWHFIIFPYTT